MKRPVTLGRCGRKRAEKDPRPSMSPAIRFPFADMAPSFSLDRRFRGPFEAGFFDLFDFLETLLGLLDVLAFG
jgi:hypothetical protein